jgi:hypothetical protein
MSMQQALDDLDRSSPQFPEQLNQLLHDGEWAANLDISPANELGELISHLDRVRSIFTSKNATYSS